MERAAESNVRPLQIKSHGRFCEALEITKALFGPFGPVCTRMCINLRISLAARLLYNFKRQLQCLCEALFGELLLCKQVQSSWQGLRA